LPRFEKQILNKVNIHERLAYLIRQATDHSATDAELEELTGLLKADATGRLAAEIAAQLRTELPRQDTDYDKDYWDNIATNILQSDRPREAMPLPPHKVRRLHRWRWAAAAAVTALLSVAAWLLLNRPSSAPAPDTVASVPSRNDVAPGGNRAILTLADGTQIPLDSAGAGQLAQQGNTSIIKLDSGRLAYRAATGATATVLYNTISTPRGGQFRITLPDGTQVWLNASSSLRYPTAFTGQERRVELTGEAYFEVAKNAGMPFRIGSKEMEVEVLGTHFNIMAYDDEEVLKTTLLEGAVKVTRRGISRQLQPGQQARVHRSGEAMEVLPDANTEEAVAWKNGFIQFDGQDINAAMRMLARWYNVEVDYRGTVPAHFRGIIPRSVPLSQVLKMMELTGEVHFSIEGNRIIVSP
jgi:ferric-dicitrate binding protein FerR (iron transport regulator)